MENRMVSGNEATTEQFKSETKREFMMWLESDAPKHAELFAMWVENYADAHEVITGNMMQARKAGRDYYDFRADILKDDFLCDFGIELDKRDVVEWSNEQ